MDPSLGDNRQVLEAELESGLNVTDNGDRPLPPNANRALFQESKTPLVRCRSLNDVDGPRKSGVAINGVAASQVAKRFEEMDTCRAHETIVNGELGAVQQEWQRLRRAYRKSRIQYENAVDPFNPQLGDSSADKTIRMLRELCINDRSLLESHSVKVRTIRRKLQLAETARARCELDFMQSARQWAMRPGVPPPPGPTSPPASTYARQPGDCPTPAPSSNDVELLVKRYQNKVAEVRSLGERLADQNYEYWNEVARRELRQDHDEKLSVTNEDFEEMYNRDREVVSQELARVIQEARLIKAESQSANTDASRRSRDFPDLESAARIAESRQGYEESLQAALARVPPEAFMDAELIRGDTSEHGSAEPEPARNSELVTSWMDDVPLGQGIDSTLVT